MIYDVSSDSWSQYSTTVGSGLVILRYLSFMRNSCPVSFYRQWRAWDFTQEAGLILAGGIIPWTDVVERSTDYGKSFQQIQTMPYGGNGRTQRTQQRTAGRVAGACLVIIDTTTVFVAGGWFGKLILMLSY